MVKGMKGRTNNAWFNVECRTQRAKVWKCLKKFLAANKGAGMKKRVEKTLVEERKMLKELCEKKRKEWFEDKWNKVRNSKTIQEWWAVINFYRPRKKRKGENIKKKEWVRHFAKLLGADNGELGAETASNYRGISLLDTGYKILTSIIGGRLNRWIETNKIIRESQAGFRMERGTRDHIFVFNSLINNRLKKVGKKLYVAFVDFKTAFDKVDRKMMLNKLWEKGIRGKMHRTLRGIYNRTINEVITGDGITKSFETGNGVRQGCPSSPIIFN